MTRSGANFLFLNVGHFLDHLFMLVFATVAALYLAEAWQMDYGDLIPYATVGFVAFGICAIPAGWLADKWSREGMMTVFFIGIGASSVLTEIADTPLQIGAGLTAIGLFAAIYHPVGLALVVEGRRKTGLPIAINGIFGNMGVAVAALLTGLLIDIAGWRAAFLAPGLFSIAAGVAYWLFIRRGPVPPPDDPAPEAAAKEAPGGKLLVRVFAVIFLTTALGGLVFQSTTFALPKVLDERLADTATSASEIGVYAFIVFALAAFAQIVVGWLVDHRPIRTVFAGVAIIQAAFFVVMLQADGLLALLVAVAFMLAVFGQIPINDVLVGRMARSEWRSRAFAARYVVTFSVMASAVPIIGWLHGSWGFNALFMVLAVTATLIFGGAMMLPKRV